MFCSSDTHPLMQQLTFHPQACTPHQVLELQYRIISSIHVCVASWTPQTPGLVVSHLHGLELGSSIFIPKSYSFLYFCVTDGSVMLPIYTFLHCSQHYLHFCGKQTIFQDNFFRKKHLWAVQGRLLFERGCSFLENATGPKALFDLMENGIYIKPISLRMLCNGKLQTPARLFSDRPVFNSLMKVISAVLNYCSDALIL